MSKISIRLDNVSKRYTREWILKNFSFDFTNETTYAITGPNGSGKSTLIELVSTYLSPTKGDIYVSINDNLIASEETHKYISICSPALNLIEEMDLKEMIRFHFRFKKPLPPYNTSQLSAMLPFDEMTMIRDYSSGMKQRLKLLLAFYSDSAVLLLDEPTTNLDAEGFAWFEKLFRELSSDRLLLMSSNLSREIDLCQDQISILDCKGSNLNIRG